MKIRNKSKELIRKDIIYMLWLIVLLVVTIWIIFEIQNIKKYSERLELVLQTPISEKDAYMMQNKSREKQENYEFVFWNQMGNEIISAPSLKDKSLEVTVVVLCGNSNLLFENTFELDYFDSDICLVDKKMAYDMFGTTEVKGLILTYEGTKFEIADVIDMDKGLFICQVSGRGENVLKRISIRDYSQKSLVYLKELFERSWTSGNRLDYELMNFLILFSIVIVFLFGTYSEVLQLWYKIRNHCSRIRQYHVLCHIIRIVIHLMVLINGLFLPKDYITNVAIQEFWTQLVEQKIENFNYFVQVEKNIFEMDYIYCAIRVIMGSIAVVMIKNQLALLELRYFNDFHVKNIKKLFVD